MGGLGAASAAAGDKKEESQLQKITCDSTKMAVEQIKGLSSQVNATRTRSSPLPPFLTNLSNPQTPRRIPFSLPSPYIPSYPVIFSHPIVAALESPFPNSAYSNRISNSSPRPYVWHPGDQGSPVQLPPKALNRRLRRRTHGDVECRALWMRRDGRTTKHRIIGDAGDSWWLQVSPGTTAFALSRACGMIDGQRRCRGDDVLAAFGLAPLCAKP